MKNLIGVLVFISLASGLSVAQAKGPKHQIKLSDMKLLGEYKMKKTLLWSHEIGYMKIYKPKKYKSKDGTIKIRRAARMVVDFLGKDLSVILQSYSPHRWDRRSSRHR